MPQAKITISTKYTNTSARPIETSETSTDKTISGKADATESRVSWDTNNPAGKEIKTERTAPPDGQVFESATIIMTLTGCPPGKSAATLTGSGNVSVEGWVENGCIYIKTVNREGNAQQNKETITELTQESCCKSAGQSALPQSENNEALLAAVDTRLDQFLAQVNALIDARMGGGSSKRGDDTGVHDGVWLGLGLREIDGELVIAGTEPAGPSAGFGLVKGDRLEAIDETPVASVSAAFEVLSGASPFKPVTLTARRSGKDNVTVALYGSPRRLPNGNMYTAFQMDKACGDDCNCTKDETRSICGKEWYLLSSPPDGAMVYEEVCITINPRKSPVKDVHSCGLAYFI